jgi:hypothetical protein
VDYGEKKLHIYTDDGLTHFATLEGEPLAKPFDVAVDEFGGLMLYDYGPERVLRFEARD